MDSSSILIGATPSAEFIRPFGQLVRFLQFEVEFEFKFRVQVHRSDPIQRILTMASTGAQTLKDMQADFIRESHALHKSMRVRIMDYLMDLLRGFKMVILGGDFDGNEITGNVRERTLRDTTLSKLLVTLCDLNPGLKFRLVCTDGIKFLSQEEHDVLRNSIVVAGVDPYTTWGVFVDETNNM